MSYKTKHKLSLFVTLLGFTSGLAAKNHIGLLIICLIIIFSFHFQTRICYVFYNTLQFISINSLQIDDH